MVFAERRVIVGDRGDVTLPADVCAELGLEPGTRLLVTAGSDGSVWLRSYRTIADCNRGLLASLCLSGTSLVDELAEGRRDDAVREGES